MMLYKLRITVRWRATRTREMRAVRELVWDNEADARACKLLLGKAKLPEFFDYEFVSVTEEEKL